MLSNIAPVPATELDIRTRLLTARQALEFAWSTWSGMVQPKSVTLRARIVVGYEWLLVNVAPDDQARGSELISQLRAQAHNEELEEEIPGKKHNVRAAWDAAEKRFLEAEREYLRLVGDAARLGVDEDGE